MPSASAQLATSTPMAPSPITPSVRPGSSEPTKSFLPFSTATSMAESSPVWARANSQAGPMLRTAMNRPAMTSSFTALALAPGVLKTGMPRAASAATGMLLVPAPARATAITESGSAILCMSAERSSTASGRSIPDATSYCARGMRSSPLGLMLFSVRMRNGSAMATLELLHEADQCRDSFRRHGVVDAGAHATHRTMPFEVGEAGLRGFGQEGLVQFRLRQCERHVHDGAEARRHRIAVEAAAIDGSVEFAGLALVALTHGSKTTELQQPAEHQPGHVPAEGGRRVGHGSIRRHLAIVPDRGRDASRLVQQVITHDDHAQPRRPDVLLRTGIDEPEA